MTQFTRTRIIKQEEKAESNGFAHVLKYDPNQPRVPAGSPGGGRFADSGGSGGSGSGGGDGGSLAGHAFRRRSQADIDAADDEYNRQETLRNMGARAPYGSKESRRADIENSSRDMPPHVRRFLGLD